MPTDERGHHFENCGNVRVTFVPHSDRVEAADWSDTDVLRIQAYRDMTGRQLHMGAELPVPSAQALLDLIRTIIATYNTGMTGGR